MKLVGIIDEDFINYKKTCMTLEFPFCSFKCDREYGQPVCQNSALANTPIINVTVDKIIDRYLNNDISEALCFQGLEPMDSWNELLGFISKFRIKCKDDIVIYTGYMEEEIFDKVKILRQYKNIIIKFGRFIPNQEKHYDNVLGVWLVSDNQYGKKI
jgi:hypothetical protein